MKHFMIIAAACAVLTACTPSDQGGDAPSFGGIKEVILHPGASAAVPVYGGGNYSVSIDKPNLADVSIDNGNQLIIKTHKDVDGSALVAVTNLDGGKFADIYLVVHNENMNKGWRIDERQCVVEAAANVAEIEADIQSRWFPLGGIIFFDPSTEDSYTIAAGNWVVRPGGEITPADAQWPNGTFTMHPLDLHHLTSSLPKTYAALPIEQQLSSALHYDMVRDGVIHSCDLFFVYGREDHDLLDRMFYEDLTDYYKAKYPAAGVTSVVNRYVQRSSK